MYVERASRTRRHRRRNRHSHKSSLSFSLSMADAICRVLSLIPSSLSLMNQPFDHSYSLILSTQFYDDRARGGRTSALTFVRLLYGPLSLQELTLRFRHFDFCRADLLEQREETLSHILLSNFDPSPRLLLLKAIDEIKIRRFHRHRCRK